MLKIKKKYLFIIVLLILVFTYFFGKSFFSSSSEKDVSFSLEKVQTWSIQNTISVVWTAELVNEQALKFTQQWKVTMVNFKDWDKIKKWNIIAELDKKDVYNSIEQAELDLENSKINLKQLYEPVDESKILESENSIKNNEKTLKISKEELKNTNNSNLFSLNQMEQNINNLKKELENLKNTQNNSLEDLQKNINSSKESLELAKKELETVKKEQWDSLSKTSISKNSTIQKIEDSFSSDLSEAEKIIEQLDYILGVSDKNEDKNDSYEDNLWAKKSYIKSSAMSYLTEVIADFAKLEKEINLYDNLWDKDKIKNILTLEVSLFKSLEKTADLTYDTLDYSIANSYLTESLIETKKSSVSSYRSSSQNKVISLNSTISSLETLTNTDLVSEVNSNSLSWKELSIKNSENNLEKLVKSFNEIKASYELVLKKKQDELDNGNKNYENTKKSYSLNIESLKQKIEASTKNIEVAKISLKELKEWPTEENIRKANNAIKQAEIKLENAKEWLDKYELEAPFDGIVRKIDYKIWDNLVSDSDKYVYLENPNLVEISSMLDQIDIWNVKIGTKALIKFDAFSKEEVSAVITSIDTTPVQSSWVVSYEVKFVISDKKFNKKILSWMTANIDIITASSENTLLLKSSAITSRDWKNYVTIQKNNWTKSKAEVVIWIESNGKTEIKSWLKEWETVLIRNISSSWSWATTKTKSLFSPPSWGSRNSSWPRDF